MSSIAEEKFSALMEQSSQAFPPLFMAPSTESCHSSKGAAATAIGAGARFAREWRLGEDTSDYHQRRRSLIRRQGSHVGKGPRAGAALMEVEVLEAELQQDMSG